MSSTSNKRIRRPLEVRSSGSRKESTPEKDFCRSVSMSGGASDSRPNPNSEGPAMASTVFAGCDLAGGKGTLLRTGACRGSLLRVSATRAGTWAAATVGVGAGGCDSSVVPHIPQKRKAGEFSSPQFGQITSASPKTLILQCKPVVGRPRARSFILEFSDSIFPVCRNPRRPRVIP